MQQSFAQSLFSRFSLFAFVGTSKNNLTWKRLLFIFLIAGGAVNSFSQGVAPNHPASSPQFAGCDDLHPNIINYQPCCYRLQIDNTSDCYPSLRIILFGGSFASWAANTPAGWTGTVLSPGEILLTHSSGQVPMGGSTPISFCLVPGTSPDLQVQWEFTCVPAASCIAFYTLDGCPDPNDASITGVKYRECGSSPYVNQPKIPGWTMSLLDADGNIVSQQQTASDGTYGFYDLPGGAYTVKEETRPGWTATAPASGQATFNLIPSQKKVQNFGNCPSCSCDSIYMHLSQLAGILDTSTYFLTLSNNGAYCFSYINIQVDTGQLVDWSLLLPGWTAVLQGPNLLKLSPPGPLLPGGGAIPLSFRVRGAGVHAIMVSTFWNTGGGNMPCNRTFVFQSPPMLFPPLSCCPAGMIVGPELVCEGDFPYGEACFDWSNDYINAPINGPGHIAVVKSDQVPAINPVWACASKSGSPNDYFLIVDASTTPGAVAWEEIIPITANTVYGYGAYLNNIVIPTAQLPNPTVQLQIVDGMGSIIDVLSTNLPQTPDKWVLACRQWTSPATLKPPYRLQIVALFAVQNGNDFAVDCISFRKCSPPPPSCTCKENPTFQYTDPQGTTYPLICSPEIAPTIPCPTPGTVKITGNFGCVDANGNTCEPPAPINWQLIGPGNIPLDAGMFIPGDPWGLNFAWPLLSGPGLYTLSLSTHCAGQADSCVCQVKWYQECQTCTCTGNILDITSGNETYHIGCFHPVDPILPCPTGPVTVTGKFGCALDDGTDCTSAVNWELYGPNGLIKQGVINGSSVIALPFTAQEVGAPGDYFLKLATLCPGSMDSCICVGRWKQESCDSCTCGPFDMGITIAGGANQPVYCGDLVTVPSNFTFHTSFSCQGGPCESEFVHWTFRDPSGGNPQNGSATTSPNFTIPPLNPANLTIDGIYTLEMYAICGDDTCWCTVRFCLPPPRPEVHDTTICRTLTSAYIPLFGCPTTCGVTQVRWFVKPCMTGPWSTTPYQVSSGPGCSDLLILPNRYPPPETCIQVYAELTLDGSCCTTRLFTDTATIILCDPNACSITNPNLPGCQQVSPQALTVVPTGTNCNYTVQWYYQGQPISNATGLSYQPPPLTYQPNGASNCYKDHVYSAVVTGKCGPSTCSTTIRVYNPNAPNGTLDMVPLEPQPFCPGEDATLIYTPACAGEPQQWNWYYSIDLGITYPPILNMGNKNPKLNTNKLFQTTWFKVEKQNGVCPAANVVYKIEVKDRLLINGFTAVPDPCVDMQVALNVDFTPTPIAGTGCRYVIDWYKNGVLIHTSNSDMGIVSWVYQSPTPGQGSVAGVYYAIVRDDCCPQTVKTPALIIYPTCKPIIEGPCYRCDDEPITMQGHMVLPPNNACPNTSGCTYKWYQILETSPGMPTWVLIGTGTTITVNSAGHFIFESICNGCRRYVQHDVTQCVGCIESGAIEAHLDLGTKVKIHPNPTSGAMTVQITPSPLRHGRVEIAATDGRVLLSESIPEHKESHTIALDRLATGLYFVRVYENEVLIWTEKIVKAK